MTIPVASPSNAQAVAASYARMVRSAPQADVTAQPDTLSQADSVEQLAELLKIALGSSRAQRGSASGWTSYRDIPTLSQDVMLMTSADDI
ncbi:MAG TPA: hypothetical protein VL424_16225, partial [Pararobbsia sp.]|nr:hypothetical protein [Pararobbsia sp.]